MAAVGLLAAGAVVESWGALIYAAGHMGGATESAHGVFRVGLGIAVAGLLAGIPPALYWWSRRPLNDR
ncbi:hypothetical protein [Amycolatopsis silviterrae]|uniref:Uncharacterized protein n=1 Tax=Amycolatopsis silviterrae TaxID=1656914 RepID=A0ABW5H3S9_9PSEU